MVVKWMVFVKYIALRSPQWILDSMPKNYHTTETQYYCGTVTKKH